MGVHGLPIDTGRSEGVPRHLHCCDMCHTTAIGDDHHFICVCQSLDPVRHRFCHLFASGTRSLILFIWQKVLRAAVSFVEEGFAIPNLLVPVGAVPSYQHRVAVQM